jgi:hypothetical protein
MAEDSKPATFDVGAIMAFVAPGFLAFASLGYHSPLVKGWLSAAVDKEQSLVGASLFMFLASLAIGLVVSGVRALSIDRLLRCKWLGKYAVEQLSLDWAKLHHDDLPVLLTIRDNSYRYYQFYSNALVALVFATVARWYAQVPSLKFSVRAGIATVLLVLLLSARDSLKSYITYVKQLMTKPEVRTHE